MYPCIDIVANKRGNMNVWLMYECVADVLFSSSSKLVTYVLVVCVSGLRSVSEAHTVKA
jgi:hypothetical protein